MASITGWTLWFREDRAAKASDFQGGYDERLVLTTEGRLMRVRQGWGRASGNTFVEQPDNTVDAATIAKLRRGSGR